MYIEQLHYINRCNAKIENYLKEILLAGSSRFYAVTIMRNAHTRDVRTYVPSGNVCNRFVHDYWLCMVADDASKITRRTK